MAKKLSYRVRNWKDYNEALVKRGSITIWFDEKSIKDWYAADQTGRRGHPVVYSDRAIECALTIRSVFHLPLRGTEGFVKSLIQWSGLPLTCPDYSTLSIRQKSLEVKIPLVRKKHSEPKLHLVMDSTGLKVYGEGEWKVRQHGWSKRRTWRKLHLAVDAQTQGIEAVVVSTNDFKDSELVPDLLDQVKKPLDQVSADGGYDSHECYELIAGRGARAVIPPRKDAVIAQHGNCIEEPLVRDEVIRAIRAQGRKSWKEHSGYHARSLVETAMFRIKTIFGEHLSSRCFESQGTEALLWCRALNKMTQLGMPESYPII